MAAREPPLQIAKWALGGALHMWQDTGDVRDRRMQFNSAINVVVLWL
jgi:hypothetical protein